MLLEDAGEGEEASKKKRFQAIASSKVEGEKRRVSRLCAIADVSAKCYYQSLKPKPKEEEDARLIEEIRKLQEARFYSLGYRKMAVELSRSLGKPANEKRVERLMRQGGLLSRLRRKKYSEEVYATRRSIRHMKIPDLVGRRFFSSRPSRVFVQDITYLPCLEGTLYLNIIMDLYNGEIVAWKISKSPDTQLVLDCLELLVEKLEGKTEGVILHSDRGSSYTSCAYRARLKELGMRISLGSKGSCYDNARMESLNGIIKTEALYCAFGKSKVNGKRVPQAAITEKVEWFIEYYNNERAKKSLRHLSPVQFRLLNPNGTELMALSGAC